MEDTGIKYPLSLDIDMRAQLWVGCYKQSGAHGDQFYWCLATLSTMCQV
jgi:hypothetical protein